ncbi:MAG: hemolysin family protein [Acidaminobacteraceae bacterium]
MSPIVQILILSTLIGFSAFFSAAETALLSLSKIRIKNLEERGSIEAKLVNKLLEKPKKLLSSILVGNNLVNIAASAVATSIGIHYYGMSGVGIATISMTIIILIFGEITPKSLAIRNSEEWAMKVAPFIRIVVWIFSPITKVLISLTNILMRLLGSKAPIQEVSVTEEELKMMISIGHDEGVLEKEEKIMLHKVFTFGDLTVRQVMVPRSEVSMLSLDSDIKKVKSFYKHKRYSRIPVYEHNQDNVIGVLFMKDLWSSEEDKNGFDIVKHMREPFYVYENDLVLKIFLDMKKRKAHLAVVRDEYGGTAGIITLEDMLEEIVGEIYDEYDEEQELLKKVGKDEFIVRGNVRIREVAEALGLEFDQGEYDTLSGFMINYFGRLPKTGEKFIYMKKLFVVEHADKKSIVSIRIKQVNYDKEDLQ